MTAYIIFGYIFAFAFGFLFNEWLRERSNVQTSKPKTRANTGGSNFPKPSIKVPIDQNRWVVPAKPVTLTTDPVVGKKIDLNNDYKIKPTKARTRNLPKKIKRTAVPVHDKDVVMNLYPATRPRVKVVTLESALRNAVVKDRPYRKIPLAIGMRA